MVNAMSSLRECYMPLAGLPATTPIHVSENGWPTGPGRSYEEQAVALEQMVRAVHDYRGNCSPAATRRRPARRSPPRASAGAG